MTTDDTSVTPMMAQYLEIRRETPGALLFYRMGDFYEMFFEDAVEAADRLGIALTSRDAVNKDDRVPMAGVPVRAVQREKGTPYAELGLGDPALTDDQLLDAMMAHPILINRPIVVAPLGVKLCRPSEEVLTLLPDPQRAAFAKEDGEQVIDADGRRLL